MGFVYKRPDQAGAALLAGAGLVLAGVLLVSRSKRKPA